MCVCMCVCVCVCVCVDRPKYKKIKNWEKEKHIMKELYQSHPLISRKEQLFTCVDVVASMQDQPGGQDSSRSQGMYSIHE